MHLYLAHADLAARESDARQRASIHKRIDEKLEIRGSEVMSDARFKQSKRTFLKTGLASVALSAPFVSRAWAQTVELTMLGWYGTAEPDMVGEFEEANNVKFVP